MGMIEKADGSSGDVRHGDAVYIKNMYRVPTYLDILLFRSNNQLGTWITRTLSRSHFDHVGIVLRFGNEVQDLYVLESVGEDGVRLTSWLCARGYVGNFFNKVGFRKLNYELDDQALDDFDVFRKKS